MCEQHKRQSQRQQDDRRGSAAARGYGAKWRAYRAGFLRGHPLCIVCQQIGRIERAVVVDHIIPHRGDADLFWSASNHQPMCKPCHDRKTATEDGGFGRAPSTPEE